MSGHLLGVPVGLSPGMASLRCTDVFRYLPSTPAPHTPHACPCTQRHAHVCTHANTPTRTHPHVCRAHTRPCLKAHFHFLLFCYHLAHRASRGERSSHEDIPLEFEAASPVKHLPGPCASPMLWCSMHSVPHSARCLTAFNPMLFIPNITAHMLAEPRGRCCPSEPEVLQE